VRSWKIRRSCKKVGKRYLGGQDVEKPRAHGAWKKREIKGGGTLNGGGGKRKWREGGLNKSEERGVISWG